MANEKQTNAFPTERYKVRVQTITPKHRIRNDILIVEATSDENARKAAEYILTKEGTAFLAIREAVKA